jgi:hypothetical protein
MVAVAAACLFTGHAVEESLWMSTMGAMTLSCMFLVYIINRCCSTTGLSAAVAEGLGDIQMYARCFSVAGVIFVIFMTAVDIPMYYYRYLADEARGAVYLSFADGVVEATSCVGGIKRDFATWHEEMPWMTGYFSAGVWVAIWLVRGPRLCFGEKER